MSHRSFRPNLPPGQRAIVENWSRLGAWRSQSDAAIGWDKAAAQAGDLLSGATPRIVEADVPGKGHFWRLRTQAPSGTAAADFCAQLRSKGLSCIVARS